MIFKKKDLQDMVFFEDSGTLIKVEDDIVGNSRWSIQHKVIFKDSASGKHYVSYYSVGATESQDESPYEHDPDEVECEEVEQREVKVTKWMAVPNQ